MKSLPLFKFKFLQEFNFYSEDRQKMDGHKARVFAVQFHPSDPHVFLTGGWDDTVQYWDSRNPRAFRQVNYTGIHPVISDMQRIKQSNCEI